MAVILQQPILLVRANKGGFIGLGDMNAWYDGGEPITTSTINTALVNFLFPNDTSTCYLFPPGCLESFSPSSSNSISVDLGNDTTLCSGDTLTLSANALSASYTWQDNSNNSTFNVTETGSYWVTVSNFCGTGSDTINVAVDEVTANLSNIVNEGCANTNNGAATFSNISGSIPGSLYVTWLNPGGNIHAIDTVTQGGNTTQNNLYGGLWTVSVQSQTGCTWDTTFFVQVGSVGVNTNLNDPQCFGTSSGSITAFSTSQGTFNFIIQDVNGQVVNNPGTNTANSLSAGTYTVSVSDDNGCTVTETVELIDPLPVTPVISLTHPLCHGFNTGSASVDSVLNAQGNYNQIYYGWTPNPAGTNGLGETSSDSLVAGEYVLEVVDDIGCSNDITFHIVEPDPLIGVLEVVSPTYCRTAGYQKGNGEVTVTTAGQGGSGSGNVTYLWENLENGDQSQNTTFIIDVPGLMKVTLTDANGCTFIDTIEVDSLNPIADFTPVSDQFTGPGEFEGTEIMDVEFINESINFSKASYAESDTTFVWNLYTNDPNQTGQGNWFFSFDYDEKIERSYTGEEEYLVCLVAKNFNDCQDTVCKNIIVHAIPIINMPNVFTPGTQPNSEFHFPNIGINTFGCSVYDRYGLEVFRFESIDDRWDGNNFKNGNACSDGVYFYSFSAVSTNGTYFEGSGNITLIRSK